MELNYYGSFVHCLVTAAWTVRGHSNNTWHFFGTFLTPRCVVFFHYLSFSSLVCFELWNEVYRKCILKPWLAVRQTFYFKKALETVFKNSKKSVWHFFRPPPPSSVTYYLNDPQGEKNEWMLNEFLSILSEFEKLILCLDCKIHCDLRS